MDDLASFVTQPQVGVLERQAEAPSVEQNVRRDCEGSGLLADD
jgi:hypothetical protein